MKQPTLDENEDLLIRAARVTKAVYSELGAMPGEINQTRLFEVVVACLFEARQTDPKIDPVVLRDPSGKLVVLSGQPGEIQAVAQAPTSHGWAFWRR